MLRLFFLSSVFLLANRVASSSSHKCEEVTEFHHCTDVSSTEVMVPNLLSQNQSVATKELSQYAPITGCSVHLKFFLCSIYAPSCPTNSTYPFPPCRAVCKQVKTDCSQHNIQWPAALDCDRFPEEGGYCKCLNNVTEVEPKPKQKDVEIIVTLPSGGRIRGSSMKTRNHGLQIFAFRGIPYAQPPIGPLRFRPPVAKSLRASRKPFDGTKEGPECLQVDDPTTGTLLGKEDCLVLNVYTTSYPPHLHTLCTTGHDQSHYHNAFWVLRICSCTETIQAIPCTITAGKNKISVAIKFPCVINQTQQEKPVMVFMHGGGFTEGSGTSDMYSPRRLLDHDVVLVTINYRLHVLGFLSTMDEESPGNYGLLDQTEALKWVQTNIRAFGGNPNNVNIFGESAGSASVLYHMLSPLSAGLFHSVIAQSGSPLCPWASVTDAAHQSEQFAESVGCTTKNKKKMMQCLRLMPAETLTLETSSSSDNSTESSFLPVVDGHFLPNSSYDLFKNGAIPNKVPVMTGVMQEEGIFSFQLLQATAAEKDFEITDEGLRKLIAIMVFIKEENVTKAAIDLLRKEYFHSVDPNDSDAIQEIIIKMLSYSIFVAPHIQTVEFLSDHGIDTFVYSFDLVTNQSIGQLFGMKPLKNQKPTHGDDLFFLFMDRTINPEVDRTEDTMLQMWTKFAQFGHPTKYLENNVPEWPKSKRDDIQIYHLDNPFNVESYDRNDDRKIQFWLEDIRHALDLER